MKFAYIDFRLYGNKQEVHRALKEQLELPEYYGNNLDALYDVLTEGGEKIFLFYRRAGVAFEEGFVETFKDSAAYNASLVLREDF